MRPIAESDRIRLKNRLAEIWARSKGMMFARVAAIDEAAARRLAELAALLFEEFRSDADIGEVLI